MVGQGKFRIEMHPFGQSHSKIIAVSGNVDQSKPDSHFNSQIDSYISCILIECVCSKMRHKCLGGTQYPALGGTYQIKMSGDCTKWASKCLGGGSGGRVEQF